VAEECAKNGEDETNPETNRVDQKIHKCLTDLSFKGIKLPTSPQGKRENRVLTG
jgi:hypothetical protein